MAKSTPPPPSCLGTLTKYCGCVPIGYICKYKGNPPRPHGPFPGEPPPDWHENSWVWKEETWQVLDAPALEAFGHKLEAFKMTLPEETDANRAQRLEQLAGFYRENKMNLDAIGHLEMARAAQGASIEETGKELGDTLRQWNMDGLAVEFYRLVPRGVEPIDAQQALILSQVHHNMALSLQVLSRNEEAASSLAQANQYEILRNRLMQ